MREETQNSVNLKLIVFFDPEDRTYGIWAHNLTSKEAPRDVETVSRITSSGTKSFSARPASSRNATSGSRLHLSSSRSAGPMQSATTHSLRTIF